jgi:thioesterase domain-containing protein
MARQYRERSRTVPALAILDSEAPGGPATRAEAADDDVGFLTAFAEHLHLAWKAPVPSLARLRALPADRLLEVVLERAKAARSVPAGISLAEARLLFDLFKTNCRAERDYTPGGYDGDAVVFRATESIGAQRVKPDLGWTSFVGAGRLTVRDVPGTHHTMLHEPNVGALAEQLFLAFGKVVA